MKKITLLILAILIFSTIVIAQEEHDFTKTKELIDSGINCIELTDNQLEEIGDYYMEQMHPGKEHELMDRMMGGEDSETLKQMHINIARRIYCKENVNWYGMTGGGMMSGSGMMGNNYNYPVSRNNVYQNNFFGFQMFFYVLLILVVIVLILIIILSINKSKNNAKQRRK